MAKRHRIEMSRRALNDLDEIAEYIRQNSPDRADRFCESIVEAIHGLERFPDRCQRASEGIVGGAQLRQLVHARYRVLFSVEGRIVRVHGVRHSARRRGLDA